MKVYCDGLKKLSTSRSFFSIIGRQVPEECLDVAEVYGAIHYNNDNTQRLSPPDSRPIHPYKMDHREPLKKLKQNRYLRGWKQRKASKKEYRKIL